MHDDAVCPEDPKLSAFWLTELGVAPPTLEGRLLRAVAWSCEKRTY